MAEIDLLCGTPLAPSDVHFVFLDGEMEGSSYSVIKKKTLIRLLDSARQAGRPVKRIRLVNRDTARPIDRKSLALIIPPTGAQRAVARLAVLIIACLIVLCIATYAQAFWRLQNAASKLDAEIEAAQEKAHVSRTMVNAYRIERTQIAHLREEKTGRPSVVRSWTELTQVLPDTTWLTDFSVRQGEFTISGFSASAAGLIAPIEASAIFAAPEFESPVVRVPGQEGERFTIRARIDAP